MNPFKYGPGRRFVKAALWLSWPVIILGKKMSSLPVLKHIISPFFAYPWNEVTYIPINVKVDPPDSVSIPLRLVKRVLALTPDIFIIDECMCRRYTGCQSYSKDIGCMVLGRAIDRMHPSHGRKVTHEEAYAHLQKASDAGLIASIAHVWIDPLAFGLTRFDKLMFICLCDDCCCLYRTFLGKRGPGLDKAAKGLPGISVSVDMNICDGCAICAERCFVKAITMKDGAALISDECRGCGRCVEICPQNALTLNFEDEEILFSRMKERIEKVADIT